MRQRQKGKPHGHRCLRLKKRARIGPFSHRLWLNLSALDGVDSGGGNDGNDADNNNNSNVVDDDDNIGAHVNVNM